MCTSIFPHSEKKRESERARERERDRMANRKRERLWQALACQSWAREAPCHPHQDLFWSPPGSLCHLDGLCVVGPDWRGCQQSPVAQYGSFFNELLNVRVLNRSDILALYHWNFNCRHIHLFAILFFWYKSLPLNKVVSTKLLCSFSLILWADMFLVLFFIRILEPHI